MHTLSRHPKNYLLLNSYGVYHFRRAVPKRFRSILKKTQIKKSLRTGNYTEAARKARKYAVETDELFHLLEDTMSTQPNYEDLSLQALVRHLNFSVEKLSGTNSPDEQQSIDLRRRGNELTIHDYIVRYAADRSRQKDLQCATEDHLAELNVHAFELLEKAA